MTNKLQKLTITKKSGKEKFHMEGKPLDIDLLSFWQWSTSDLVSNATRGILAEFIVAKAVGIPPGVVRAEWDSYDLKTEDGIRIEVKASAFLQSWYQKQFSKITFDIRKTEAWDPKTNLSEEEKRRQADVYVFALLAHKDKSTVNPLDLAQWQFYVLPTDILNEKMGDQKSISLGRLVELSGEPVAFPSLKETIYATHHRGGS